MKKSSALVVLAALALLALPTAALADNGPHGRYTMTTDDCALCHRAHTAQGEMLLSAPNEYELCMSCHGNGGTGANTDVEYGVFTSTRSAGASLQGANGSGLLGGGFVRTLMNTSLGGGAVSAPATSGHAVVGMPGYTSGTIWGYGALGDATYGGTAGHAGWALRCTDCHNPHGNAGANGTATYRILRGQATTPTAPAAQTDVPDVAAGSRSYTVAASNTAFDGSADVGVPGNYFNQSYPAETGVTGASPVFPGSTRRISELCGQCHTRHLVPDGAGSHATSSGDGVFTYRHASKNHPDCLTCHVAHGSSAAASNAAAVAYPGGASGMEAGALLRLDNRGVCFQCHGKTFISPLILAYTPATVARGANVVITGVRFSSTIGTVRFPTASGGTVAGTLVGSWTETTLTVTVPGLAVSGRVTVTSSAGLQSPAWSGPTLTVI